MYKRFILRRSDKDVLKAAEKHDEIYTEINKMFADQFSEPVPATSIIDTKFFIDEIADNFLEHDLAFDTAKIDVWIERDTLDVHIHISHNGRNFDPMSLESNCENIKNAAARLKVSPPKNDPHAHLEKKFGISYNLKKGEAKS